MHPYVCIYIDHNQKEHRFACYAKDSFHAQQQYADLVGHHGEELVRVERLEQDFDW